MRRPNLVCVRAGDASLHPRWLQGHQPRTWDLVVSYYGDHENPWPCHLQDMILTAKGPKWAPLAEMANTGFFDGYERIWLPDNDILATCDQINQLFAVSEFFDLSLCQPGLSASSFVSHEITRAHPLTRLRFTNFVEVMMPLFSQAALQLLKHTWSANRSGWGVDLLWTKLLGDPRDKIAIIDQISVDHTQPIGNTYSLQPALDEKRALMALHGLQDEHKTWSAIAK